ncbi:DUF559 domain-containing protein [Joostella sp.]|uniref:DUF559 domain-containing protein n=1 Tax=Joostella sp. TaxID=2231138 RepID=UPI003A8E803B
MPTNPCHKKLLGLLETQDWHLSRIYTDYSERWAKVLRKYGYGKSSNTNIWKGNKRIEAELDKVMIDYQKDIDTYIKSNINTGWGMSNDCNDDLVNSYTKGVELPNKEIYFGRNLEALAAYRNRVSAGLNLSDRVWNLTHQTKDQLETILKSGVMEGRSASKMATDLKEYLVEPDRRYRRIRDKNGKLVYTSPGADYHPGQGVYRSSYKNALRLARNETNIAYRSADNERRKQLDFVTGIQVNLSNAHPAYDMCFTAWQYKISTSKGLKYIKDIEVGDLVLTHKGRFRKVLRLFKSSCNEVDKTEIQYKVPYDNRSKIKKIAATSNHPFLINGEWKSIDQAKEGDYIRILATKCKSCGTKIPMYRDYCSKSCSSKNTATNQWKNPEHVKSVSEKRKKVIEDNGGIIPYFQDWINSGENIKNITSKSAKEKRVKSLKAISDKKMKDGTHPFIQPENIKKSAQALGNSHNRSFIEKKMEWLLDELKIKNETQKIIYRKETKPNGQRRYYKPDFVLSDYKIIIECDGDYWHSKTVDKDLKRQLELESMGYLVLRFKGSQIRNDLKTVSNEIQRAVYNHEGKYEFLEYPISKVRHYTQKQSTPITKWNFEVEEDNSYVVNGVVVHNCDELQGRYPKDFVFVGWHPNCLCFTTNVLLSQKEFIEYVNGGKIRQQRYTRTIPRRAENYLNDNSQQIKGWKNTPYFIRDNFKNTKDGFEVKKSIIIQ